MMFSQVTYKRNHELATFSRGRIGDAGWDLTCCASYGTVDGKYYCDTGIQVAIPKGWVGLLFPRSGIVKKDAFLANSVGVIDSNYRGNIIAVFSASQPPYQVGERCCQLVVVPCAALAEEVDHLDETNRNDQGFGSSGA